ncbi:hypothetical protein IW261DRAFT_1611127 [Armillaria novae-zelandiae]|uniref:Uncharacterized protein n=1 Tax=Armillaria novae-zelandiae TaxID=153914 RepID=A0AA39NX26_9AGAR|nr:hypothetical protein IW261DRAFT_1611127 [Armillaria novae-zelandiae]
MALPQRLTRSAIPLSFHTLQNCPKMSFYRRFTVKLRRTVKRMQGIVRRSFGRSPGRVHDPASTSDYSPPSYDIAESPPPPYAAVETHVVDNSIYAVDTVEPVPLDDEEYTLLEDPGMAGFTRSALATVFEEVVDEAVESI